MSRLAGVLPAAAGGSYEPQIAVIVVRWQGGDEVAQCLDSVIGDCDLPPAEVVLVDSGSGDGGAALLAQRFPMVTVVGLATNRSFAWAAGQGVDATTAPLIYLLNPDTRIQPGGTRILVDFLAANRDAAGVAPLLEYPDGRSQHQWQLRDLPRPLDLCRGLPGPSIFHRRPPARPTPVAQPAAAAWLIRRTAWAALGGLDPVFEPAWWEDVDFCQRLHNRLDDAEVGYRTGFWVVPAARVSHSGGSSLERLGDERFQVMYHRNLMRFVHRHHSASAWWIRRLLGVSLRARAMLRPRYRRAYEMARAAITSE